MTQPFISLSKVTVSEGQDAALLSIKDEAGNFLAYDPHLTKIHAGAFFLMLKPTEKKEGDLPDALPPVKDTKVVDAEVVS